MVFPKEALSVLYFFLLYLSKLPKLVPNTRKSLFADDFMIYAESSNADSHLIQPNLQTSLDKLTVLTPIIISS